MHTAPIYIPITEVATCHGGDPAHGPRPQGSASVIREANVGPVFLLEDIYIYIYVYRGLEFEVSRD